MPNNIILSDGIKYELIDTIHKTDDKLILKVRTLDEGLYRFAKQVRGPWCEVEKGGAELQSRAHRVDPRVVRVLKCQEDSAQGYVLVITDWVDAPTLKDLVEKFGPMPWERASRLTLQRLEMIDNLQSQAPPIIHSDIKPSNEFILEGDHLRLTDFGIAKKLEITRTHTTNNFLSIEYADPDRLVTSNITKDSDVWSAICVFAYTLIGGCPFPMGSGIPDYYSPPKLPTDVPAAVERFMKKALSPKREDRYRGVAETRKVLLEALQHRQDKSHRSPVPATTDSAKRVLEPTATILKPLSTPTPTTNPPPDPLQTRPLPNQANRQPSLQPAKARLPLGRHRNKILVPAAAICLVWFGYQANLSKQAHAASEMLTKGGSAFEGRQNLERIKRYGGTHVVYDQLERLVVERENSPNKP